MRIQSPSIGEIEFEDSQVTTFPEGMLGMPSFKRYLLLQSEEIAPFLRLQCVDEPSLSFLLIDPAYLDPGYRAYVQKADANETYIKEGADYAVFAVCKVSGGGDDITANLMAPVILNQADMRGAQVVLLDSPYDVRHSLAEVSERMEA